MAESLEQPEENNPLIRSINNDVSVNVRFSNRSGRTASLLWYDFKGKFVKYGILHHGDIMDMFTYVTHPWGARDAISGDVLNIGGQSVFYPQVPANGVQPDEFPVCNIDLPLYSLKEICLQQVQKLYPRKKIKNIEDVLPHTLVTELKEGGKHEVHYLYKNVKVSKGSHVKHTCNKDGLVEFVKLDGQIIPIGDHQLDTDSDKEEDDTSESNSRKTKSSDSCSCS